jgi:FMN-dependent oxidoreductase (nitrilotriacetate monooxygenase family)
MAEEYVEVMYKLWQSSWRDDAVKLDREKIIYTDPALVRTIDHVGKYYNVPGPHICQPSPQRTPVILQAGTSKAGKEFGARNAEAIFVSGHSPSVIAKNIAEIRTLAKEKYGRERHSIKFLALLCPIIGKTQEEAQAKYGEYLSYGSNDGASALFGGWTGIDLDKYGDDEELRHVQSKWTKHTVANHIKVGGLGATIVGTADHVADELERWVREADVDGFNIAYAVYPRTFEEVIEHLLPVLRERGLFWEDYAVPGGTYRENLYGKKGLARPPQDHPAAAFHWKAE